MAHILVVDDDEMDRLLLRTLLEGLGHDLYFAKDGEGALDLYRTRDIDVVVTDLDMPRVDGLRLIREVRDIEPRAMVIVVSGLGPGRLKMAKGLGAVATLHKPVDSAELLEALEYAVMRSELD